ncbi:MAG: aminotransferase class IV [Marinilabiliaceae bacterium]|jgi:4-amino-4-deoxychorismate lyase|nr:aminotransferase class IV [Marinilabiliaceae bacterium]
MSLLVESLKVKDGRLYNLDYHTARFNRTRKELFDIGLKIDLAKKIIIPAYARKGLFKCRIEYDDNIRLIDFIPYKPKRVESLKMVEAGDFEYPYKFIDRAGIDNLYSQRGSCDDILIIKDGFICDTSYSNVIVSNDNGRWFTPSTYLLPGTKRSYLLDKGLITETEITPASLRKYTWLRLINSMTDINDTPGIEIKTICF